MGDTSKFSKNVLENLMVMNHKSPTVSLIMSAYNAEAYLNDCIASINAQTFDDYEVIVVNDGSTDNTLDILQKWSKYNDRVHILSRENNGLTSALNWAISASHGRFIARHDADDISAPDRLEKQVDFLNKNNKIILTGSWIVEFVDNDNPTVLYTPPVSHLFIENCLLQGVNPLVHGSIMFKKCVFDKLASGYRFRYCQDYDLYLRFLSLGKFGIVPLPLYALGHRENKITLTTWNARSYLKKLIMHVNGLDSYNILDDKFLRPCASMNSIEKMENYVLENLVLLPEKRIRAQYYLTQMGYLLETGKRIQALYSSLKSLTCDPLWWKSLLSLFVGIAGIATPQIILKLHRRNNPLAIFRTPCSANHINEIFHSY